MGWSYRKNVNLGPFRVNISKAGLGYSVGAKDFRVGVNARGRRYESITIPGTGLTYRSSKKASGQGMGCAVMALLLAALVALGIHGLVVLH
jgi:hypothetical protein